MVDYLLKARLADKYLPSDGFTKKDSMAIRAKGMPDISNFFWISCSTL